VGIPVKKQIARRRIIKRIIKNKIDGYI